MSGFNQDPTPQFGQADYVGTPGNDHCQYCDQPVSGTYYRVNEAIACPACTEKMRAGRVADKHAAYVRALARGIGAALLGMIGYAVIAIVMQGWVISIMSIGVGWLVGTAMMKGSNSVGGRRYQITAALLTYAAVSTAAIPIWIHFSDQDKQPRQSQQQQLQDEQRQLEDESGQQHEPQPAPEVQTAPVNAVSLGTWLGRVALLGLASPFIELTDNPGWGAMGLLILFFGMSRAWRITAGRPFQVFGPFESAPQPSH
jgi:hypothetical protein